MTLAGLDDGGKNPILSFKLHGAGRTVEFFTKDLKTLRDISYTLNGPSESGRYDVNMLHDLFQANSTDGALDLVTLKQCISAVSPTFNSKHGDLLERFFSVCDTNGDGKPSEMECTSGWSIFVAGGKSDKLCCAFLRFMGDGNRRMSRLRLHQFLRSFLSMLLALNEGMSELSPPKIQEEIHEGIVYAMERLFSEGDCADSDSVSFDEFQQWYNSGGFHVVPWLELLALEKWPTTTTPTNGSADIVNDSGSEKTDVLKDSPTHLSSSTDGSAGSEAERVEGNYDMSNGKVEGDLDSEEEPEDDGGDVEVVSDVDIDDTLDEAETVVFQFNVLRADDGLLQVRRHDVQNLRLIEAESGLYRVGVELLAALFKETANMYALGSSEDTGTLLSKAGFDECMQQLVPYEGMFEEEVEFIKEAASNIFSAFDRGDQDEADVAELYCGMCVLGAGSKSDKLALAFKLFDTDDDDQLNRFDMFRFLRSFLTALLTLTSHASTLDAVEVFESVDLAAVQLTNLVFAAVGRDTKGEGEGGGEEGGEASERNSRSSLLTFVEFGEWYSAGGFQIVPWLELLDLKKWPGALDGLVDNRCDCNSVPEHLTQLWAQCQSPLSFASTVAFAFRLADGLEFQVLNRDVVRLKRLVCLLGLGEMEPTDLCELLAEGVEGVTEEDGERMLTREAYVSALSGLFISDASEVDRAWGTRVLLRVFDAFDVRGEGRVSLVDLSSGFILFGAGSKSDKLHVAFRQFPLSESGCMSRGMLGRYLWSFLAMLLSLSADSNYDGSVPTTSSPPGQDVEQQQRQQQLQQLRRFCDVASGASVRVVLDEEGEEVEVSFERFADWYTEGGFNHLPWLELLDLKKWVPFTGDTTGAEDGGEEDEDDDEEELKESEGEEEEEEHGGVEEGELEEEDGSEGEQGIQDREETDVVFSFHMAGHKLTEEEEEEEEEELLVIYKDGLMCLARLVSLLDLRLPLQDVYAMFDAYADADMGVGEDAEARKQGGGGRRMSEEAYLACVNELVSGYEGVGEEEQEFLELALSGLFRAYEREGEGGGDGRVDVDELVCGFTLLVAGSKSDKLDGAFRRFADAERGVEAGAGGDRGRDGDDGDDGQLSVHGMARYLGSFLTALVFFSSQSALDELYLMRLGGVEAHNRSPSISLSLEGKAHALSLAVFELSCEERQEEDACINSSGGGDTISFDAFARWYTNGGYVEIAWMELLDYKKWPVQELLVEGGGGEEDEEGGGVENGYESEDDENEEEFEGEGDGDGDEYYEDEEDGEEEEDEDDSVMFEFEILDGGGLLQVLKRDVVNLDALVGISGLRDTPPELFCQTCLALASPDGRILKAGFDEAIRRLVATSRPGLVVDMESDNVLSNIFLAFDGGEVGARGGGGGGGIDIDVDVRELVGGMILLCAGCKSDKLALAFHLLDTDGDGLLSFPQLCRFFASFLTVMLAMLEQAANLTPGQVCGVVEEGAERAAQMLVAGVKGCQPEDAGGECAHPSVSFEMLGSWYNTVGFEVVPWLELLDLKKWFTTVPSTSYSEGDQGGVGEEESGDEEEEEESGDTSEGEETAEGSLCWGQREDEIVFEFNMGDVEASTSATAAAAAAGGGGRVATKGDVLDIQRQDVAVLYQLLTSSGLAVLPMDHVCDVSTVCMPAETATIASFLQFSRLLIRSAILKGGGANKEVVEGTFLHSALADVYDTFDRRGQNRVHVVEVVSGFSLLCAGSKSDKLSLAFQLFDADGDGCLTRRELWRYLRSFLTMLLAVAGGAREGRRELALFADNASVVAAARVFQEAQLVDSRRVDFQGFADWYTYGGHHVVPWLELLDLRKWPWPGKLLG